jgi:uncharacterized LabA/DUF88 family protein
MGLFISWNIPSMPPEPLIKITVAFVDGQNLFHCVKEAFGCVYPNYDVKALAQTVCASKGWQLTETRFYTGVPDPADDPFWNYFWAGKLLTMSRQRGVKVYSRSLRYRNKVISLPNGQTFTIRIGEEKGVDVRLAIDVIRMAQKDLYDVALIFSQDQDLSEVAEEIREMAQEQGRWIKIVSAYPDSSKNRRGINKTDWVSFDQATYDKCLDPRDYRPSRV